MDPRREPVNSAMVFPRLSHISAISLLESLADQASRTEVEKNSGVDLGLGIYRKCTCSEGYLFLEGFNSTFLTF